METKRSFRDNIVRVAALVGLILVLVLGAWGAILLALNLPIIANNVGTSIVSLFNYNAATTTPGTTTVDALGVSAPASAKSGSSFVLSWDAVAGQNYTVSYDCQNGLAIKAPLPNGSYQTAPCSTPFNYVGAASKMTLMPVLTGSATLPVTINVSGTRDSTTVVASGSAVVSVTKADEVTPAPTTPATGSTGSTGGTTYVPAPRTNTLSGNADLRVVINSINSLSSQQGRVAVVFTVENVGTNVAPAGWMFTANLPVGYSYTYSSATQQALYPGDKIVYTLGFNSAVSNSNQNCNQQYPNQNCPWYQTPYQPYPYQGTCYRYDGYQNMPVACADNNGQPIYTNQNYNQIYNQGYDYNYTNSAYYNGRLVTIIVDPRNWVSDYNRANNTATISSPLY